jgi:excisionase family DNA binding protein
VRPETTWYRGKSMNPTILLNVREACSALRISRRTLHELVRRGDLPAVRLSDARKAGLRFRLADLEQWAAQRVRRGARQQAEAAELVEGQGHADAR